MIHLINKFNFLDNIYIEANTNSGTWSYQLMNEIRLKTCKFKDFEFEEIINNLLFLMEDFECSSLKRFKLSQLLNIIKSNNKDICENILFKNINRINFIINLSKDSKLGIPTIKLLESLIEKKEKKSIKILTPTPEMMKQIDNLKFFKLQKSSSQKDNT